jgi:hypothetical protein
MHKTLIEVELRDLKGRICLTEQQDDNDEPAINEFQRRIEENIGGLLCFDHIHVPECKATYSINRWVIRIDCCCCDQLDQVEYRLKRTFYKIT